MRFLLFALALLLTGSAASAQGLTPCSSATISVSNTSSNVKLSACSGTVLLWNVGATEAFYTYGTASTTAATTSNFSIPSTSFVVLNVGTGAPYLAAITTASTTTLRITQGIAR